MSSSIGEQVLVVDESGEVIRELHRVSTLALKEANYQTLVEHSIGAIESSLKASGLIAEDSQLFFVAREFRCIDVLLAEMGPGRHEGLEVRRLVLVETKLFRNSDSKRRVLAQLLEYADTLQHEVRSEEVCKAARGRSFNSEETRDELARVLASGDFLLLVCGDRLQSSLVRLMKPFLDRLRHATSRFDMGLLSLAMYRGEGRSPELYLVPNVVGLIERSERQLELNVDVRVMSEAGIELRAESATRGSVNTTAEPDEDHFFRSLSERLTDEEREPTIGSIHDVLTRARTDGFEVIWGRTKKGGSLYFMLKSSVSDARLFTIYSSGSALTMRRSFVGRLERSDLSRALTTLHDELDEEYLEERDDYWLDPNDIRFPDAALKFCRDVRDRLASA